MANKKTVVQKYEIIKALLNGETVEDFTVEEALAFCDERIEITQKKNANRSAEPTPKQKEKMAHDAELRGKVVAVMTEGETYTPSDLVKLVDNAEIPTPQKITPMLTALVADGVLTKATVKGRSIYSLSADTADEVEE